MDISKVLIIGATGYYGIYLSKDSFFSESLKISRRKKGKIKNLIQLDINKENLIEKIGNSNLDFVINLSRANPDSSNEEHIKFNENSIKNIVDFCNKRKAVLIHFSTVMVDEKFNTEDAHHKEYRNGKLVAEKIINERLEKGLILRPHLIVTPKYWRWYLLSILMKFKFLKKIFIFLIPNKLLKYKLSNPIYYTDVTRVLKKIISEKNLFDFNKKEKFYLKGPSEQTILEIFEEKRNIKKISKLEEKLKLEFNFFL